MDSTQKIATLTKASACLDCGKCTSVCVVARHDSGFSPRMLVYDAIHEYENRILNDNRLWQCLTCAACETICTSGVLFNEFVQLLRQGAQELGICGQCTHGGALQSLMHIMTSDHLDQDRLGWTSGLQIASTSDTLYFVGCAPYFETFFTDLNVKALKGATGSVSLLNRMGIIPAISPNERCCGHDLINSGDIDGFLKLAKLNVREIAATGAKRVVVSCPEGYHTLKNEYPRHLGSIDFEVVHIMEMVAEAVDRGEVKFHRMNKRVTLHDPCRLGRLSGICDEPRAILKAIPGLQVTEMKHHRNTALCCGTQSWMNCGALNKQIQMELLREAKATGAEILLTACPKCKVHLKCAMHDKAAGEDIQIEIKDFNGFVTNALAKQEVNI